MAQELTEYTSPTYGSPYYDIDEVDAVLAEKDKEIQALKQKLMAYGDTNARLVKENTDLKLINESKEPEIAELKNEINRKEGVGQRWFERCMEARTENVRLKRALWIARAERAASWQIHFSLSHNHSIGREFTINGASMACEGMMTMRPAREWSMIWKKVAIKCRAKAEYK